MPSLLRSPMLRRSSTGRAGPARGHTAAGTVTDGMPKDDKEMDTMLMPDIWMAGPSRVRRPQTGLAATAVPVVR